MDLNDLSVDHVSPSEDVIDKSLSVSGLNLDDPLSDYSAAEMRDAFRVGHEMGTLAGNAAPATSAEVHAVAKRLHIRECGACHGADQSCAQIEETFMAEARLMLAEARKARLSA